MKVSAFAHSNAPIGRWHYQVEKELQESGMAWTMLRPHHFMLNLVAQTEYVIKEGAIYSPSGEGKIPYIDPRDVAAVAFVTLTQPGHDGKTYVLTGSEAISYRQASEIIGAVIGKKLRFVDESPEQARARRIREGVPPAVNAAAGKCEGRKSWAEINPELVREAKRLRRRSPTGHRRSLRDVAAELAKLGFVNQRGAEFSASSVQSMLAAL